MNICYYEDITDIFYKKTSFEEIESVRAIINHVRDSKDSAVIEYAKQFDHEEIRELRLSPEEIDKCISMVDSSSLQAIKYAIENVKEFAKKQLATLSNLEVNIAGNILGHKVIPLDSVGCYVPGGNYPLPSSAIMTITPAKVAGVKRVIAASPKIKPITVAAMKLAGADEIYRIGGVQAIAAMAYGTESIKKVNKIVGPGNKFVTAAKKMVYGDCGIDFLAGPSEVMIIADKTANADFVAADMLAQCEHDRDARAYLICFSEEFAQSVEKQAQKFLKTLPTKEIAQESFDKSLAIVVSTLEEAVQIANEKAPEHLELCLSNAGAKSDLFRNYGSLFLGNYSAEVYGDYVTGTNHTLPTNQVSKYTGGLSVFDFVKVQTYQLIQRSSLPHIAAEASILAAQEGLFAHKLAADIRYPNRLKQVLRKKKSEE